MLHFAFIFFILLFFFLYTFSKLCQLVTYLLLFYSVFPEFFHFCIIIYLLSSSSSLHFGFFSPPNSWQNMFTTFFCPIIFYRRMYFVHKFCSFLPFVLEYFCIEVIVFYYSSLNDFCFPRPGIYNSFLEKGQLAFLSSTVSEYKGPLLLRAYTKLKCLLKICLLGLNLSSFLLNLLWFCWGGK